MEDAKTIKISSKVYAELKKPSDFAGAWVMSDEEEKEIKESLRELWRTWKMD